MDNLFHRVSVRQFKDQPVEEEKIKEMLHAGAKCRQSAPVGVLCGHE